MNWSIVMAEQSLAIFRINLSLITGVGWTVKELNPSWGEFSASVYTGPWAHPASYTMVTGLFSWVKWLGCGNNQPLPSSTEAKEGVVLYQYSFSGVLWQVGIFQ
jgi:hypothetical protein